MDDNEHENSINTPRQLPESGYNSPVKMYSPEHKLKKPYRIVSVKNTGASQKHIIVDRHTRGHEVAAGQTVDGIEMLDDDIEYFAKANSKGHPVTVTVASEQPHLAQPKPPQQTEAERIEQQRRQQQQQQGGKK